MKVLKKILIAILVLVLILVGVAYLLPKEVKVERSAVINAPPEVVFEQINTLKNWEIWSPWHAIDPDMQITYSSTASGEGAYYEWKSANKQVGDGKLTILKSYPVDSILVEMDFGEQGVATVSYLFEKVDDGTKVTWTMVSDMGMNPINRYMGLMMDNMVGESFEKGLENLEEASKNAPQAGFIVEEKVIPEQKYIAYYAKSSMEEMPQKMGEAFGALMKFMQDNDLQATGAPFTIYLDYDETETTFECGIPVAEDVETSGDIGMRNMASADALMTIHKGAYENLGETYNKFMKWVKENDKNVTGTAIEIYLTDPQAEPDTSKWVTEVYFPLK